MSGIAGVYRLDGGVVEAAELAAMSAALAHRGTDAAGVWVDASIGLAHRLLATTRASLAVRHPAADTSGAVRLVWDGRLDNRDELEAGADESDEAVVLRGYARWGDELPARLLGDFALALWDARRRRLLCARDRLGLKPFHYVWRQGVFRFASEAEPLLRALDGPEPDDEMVLALLLREFRPGDEDRTLVRDVHRLPPGHALIVDGDGLRCFRYWALDPTRTLTLGSDAEYVERVRAVFREAVAARLRTDWPVGALLSGGLDSSAIVCAAGRTWEERGEGSPPLQTFTLFADHPAGDEREPARVVTEATGLKGHAVRRLDADPLDGLDAEVDAAGRPIVDPSHHTMAGCLDAIGGAGCRGVLSGEGRHQLSNAPVHMASLLRRRPAAAALTRPAGQGRLDRAGRPRAEAQLRERSAAREPLGTARPLRASRRRRAAGGALSPRRGRSALGGLVPRDRRPMARAPRERSDAMSKPARPTRKPYRPPRLTRFGDLRTLTRGNMKTRTEPSGMKNKAGDA